ncbi:MAG: hypothetical protein ABIQ15_09070 [Nocardioides sp.]
MGIVVGLLVNLVVRPPLRGRTAIAALDRIDDRACGLLVDMATGLRDGCDEDDVTDWVDRTRSLDSELDQAWSLVRQAQESARMNPRRSAREVARSPRPTSSRSGRPASGSTPWSTRSGGSTRHRHCGQSTAG